MASVKTLRSLCSRDITLSFIKSFMLQVKICPFFFCSVQGKKHFFFLDLTLFLNMSTKLVPCLIMQQSTSQFPIQGSNKISPTKNIALPEQNIQRIIEATKTADDGKKKWWSGLARVQLFWAAGVWLPSWEGEYA